MQTSFANITEVSRKHTIFITRNNGGSCKSDKAHGEHSLYYILVLTGLDVENKKKTGEGKLKLSCSKKSEANL